MEKTTIQKSDKDIDNKDVHKLNVDKTERWTPRWYAVHTYSGYEDAVVRYLMQRISSLYMEKKIFKVIVPKEKEIKIRNGKRKLVEEKIYPGYVLVNMIMTEDSWYVVRNTPKVMGFVGPDPTKPTPLSKDEIERLIMRMEDDTETKFKVDLSEGDLIKIVDGPFKGYEGKVITVSGQGRVKVSIPVFGRDTDVELESIQVQKI